jgi:ribulose-phosphate 3-epimerase
MGPLVVEAVRRATDLPLDCHLMISDPDRFIGELARAGANLISVHVEAVAHIHRTITAIRDLGCRPGVVLNPGSPIVNVEELLPFVDYVLVMSVNPGFGGQAFIPFAAEKISRLRALAGARPIDIEVDGGVTPETASLVAQAGANVLVAGSAVFKGGKADAYRANIAAIRNAAALARGEAA